MWVGDNILYWRIKHLFEQLQSYFECVLFSEITDQTQVFGLGMTQNFRISLGLIKFEKRFCLILKPAQLAFSL